MVINPAKGAGARERLPDAMWLTLADAICWLAQGHPTGINPLRSDLTEREIDKAWEFVCAGARTGKVALSGIPWDGRKSLRMDPENLGHRLSEKPEDIDPRYFSIAPSFVQWAAKRPDVFRIRGIGGLHYQRREVWWPLPATGWSDVFVKRDDLVKYARDSNWVAASPASTQSHLGGPAVSLPAPGRRSRKVDATEDEKVRETHNILGREAKRLLKQDLSRAAMATILAKHPTNHHRHQPETIKKMLAGTYGPFVKRGLGALGT